MRDKLVQGSLTAAQRAIRHYLIEEHDQFLIHAGMCFEQLGKASLAQIHPSLIVDRDFDSLLHVCAASKHAKRPPWNIKTITATEVLQRCTQLHPGLTEFTARLKLLADFRNSAIHLGEIVEEEQNEIFHAFLAGTSLIIDAIGVSRSEFFGEFEELVAAHLDKSLADVNRQVAEKVARARSEYDQKYGGLEAVHATSIAISVEGAYMPTRYEQELVSCPACDHLGLLSGAFDVDWQADFDDDGTPVNAFPIVTLYASNFICNLCGLELNGIGELRAAGVPESVLIEDVEPSDFYSHPDYP